MSEIISSTEALYKVAKILPKGSTILDIGAGEGIHANWFRDRGYSVQTNDITEGHDFVMPFNKLAWSLLTYCGTQFDCTWASHVLEHQLNVNEFIQDMKDCTREGGLLAITVPPRKDNLVGGHLSLFTPLSLIYNMILAGLDCSEASMLYYDYNISVVVKKKSIELPELKYDNGDIETLAPYFPVPVKQNINGFKFSDINW